jgi:hypothetical protein
MMELRQIVRDQKLINFDYKLKGFISEADDEKVDPKDAFAGMTKAKNPSKKYWYVKDGIYKAVVDPPKEGGWELADKKKAEADKKAKKSATRAAPGGTGGKGKEKDTEADRTDSDRELSDKELDDIVGEHFGTERGTTGYYNEEMEKGVDPTNDPSDPTWPNDREARQTSWETGHSKGQPPGKPKSGTTGRPMEAAPGDAGSLFNELGSNEAADLLHKMDASGEELSDEEVAQILDRQFGETHAAIQNGSGDLKREKEYKDKLLAAARAGRRKNDRMKIALENAAKDGFGVEGFVRAETLYGSADSIQAARNQVASADRFFGQDGEITEVPSDERTKDEFRESIGSSQLAAARKLTGGRVVKSRAQLEELGLPFPADLIELERGDSGKVVGINEEAMDKYIKDLFPEDFDSLSDDEKSEKIKKFMEAVVLSAGGGNNPADTTTIIKDNGNLIVLQHSDKADLKAQLANSTPTKELNRAGEEIQRMVRPPSKLSDDQAQQALAINEQAIESIKEEESQLATVKEQPLKDLAAFVQTDKEAEKVLAVLNNPDGDTSLKDRWDKFKKQPPRDKMSEVEALQHFTEEISNPDHKVTGPENRIIEKLRKQMIKNPERVTDSKGNAWGGSQLDSSQAQAKIRKATVKILQERIASLNEIETKDGNRLGDVVETRKLIDILHLYQMDDPSRGVYVNGMTETVAGADGVTKENLKRCLGVESSEDLIGKMKVGPPQIPEGEDYVSDDELGVPEAFLVRNTSEPEVDEEGQVLYWLYNEEGRKDGKTADEEAAKNSSPKKKKVAEPVGTVTGQKAVAYYEDEETGERFEIAHMEIRAKGGPQAPLGTGYGWSKQMQDCLGKKDDETNESIIILGNILTETKQNTLSYHLTKSEEDYSVDQFIREINEGSLN